MSTQHAFEFYASERFAPPTRVGVHYKPSPRKHNLKSSVAATLIVAALFIVLILQSLNVLARNDYPPPTDLLTTMEIAP